jgi:hypothetical protein
MSAGVPQRDGQRSSEAGPWLGQARGLAAAVGTIGRAALIHGPRRRSVSRETSAPGCPRGAARRGRSGTMNPNRLRRVDTFLMWPVSARAVSSLVGPCHVVLTAGRDACRTWQLPERASGPRRRSDQASRIRRGATDEQLGRVGCTCSERLGVANAIGSGSPCTTSPRPFVDCVRPAMAIRAKAYPRSADHVAAAGRLWHGCP